MLIHQSLQSQYAQALVNRGDYQAAYEWIAKVLAAELAWTDYEQSALRGQVTSWLDQQGEYERLVDYLKQWTALDPESGTPYQQLLSALLRLDRAADYDKLLGDWLQLAAGDKKLSPAETARLSAAINQALGQGYSIYSDSIEQRWLLDERLRFLESRRGYGLRFWRRDLFSQNRFWRRLFFRFGFWRRRRDHRLRLRRRLRFGNWLWLDFRDYRLWRSRFRLGRLRRRDGVVGRERPFRGIFRGLFSRHFRRGLGHDRRGGLGFRWFVGRQRLWFFLGGDLSRRLGEISRLSHKLCWNGLFDWCGLNDNFRLGNRLFDGLLRRSLCFRYGFHLDGGHDRLFGFGFCGVSRHRFARLARLRRAIFWERRILRLSHLLRIALSAGADYRDVPGQGKAGSLTSP